MTLYSLIKDLPWSSSHKQQSGLYSELIAKLFQVHRFNTKKKKTLLMKYFFVLFYWMRLSLILTLFFSRIDKFFAHYIYLLFTDAVKTLRLTKKEKKKQLLNVNLP